jgi:hypothetical protein
MRYKKPDGESIIATVNKRLQHRIIIFDQDKDPRAVFTTAYQIATEAVQAEIVERWGFYDPGWLAELAQHFAQYYLDACDAYDRGYREKLPEVWEKVFITLGAGPSSSAMWRVTTLEALILPLLVHTIHDLPLAVADQLTGTSSLQTHIHDFQKINELIAQEIEDAQEILSKKYNPLLRYLDRWAGWHDEFLTYHILQVLRGTAWYDAVRLYVTRQERLELHRKLKENRLDPRDIDDIAARIQQVEEQHKEINKTIITRTMAYIDMVLTPPWPVRILLHLVRVSAAIVEVGVKFIGLFINLIDTNRAPSGGSPLASSHH